uniref:Putative scp euk: scp-like extracellular protein n=1 Tax=Corethrella appendiculata TaxID=1370023 RepID=U5EVJ6_9DIPT
MKVLIVGFVLAAFCGVVMCNDCPSCPCNYPNIFCAGKSSASGCVVIELTLAQRQILLDAHNQCRSNVAKGLNPALPFPTGLTEVTWDADLAKGATQNANQCVNGHDQCRNTPTCQNAGQNIYQGSSSQPITNFDVHLQSAVKKWCDENTSCDAAQIASYLETTPNGVIGHFTQIVNEQSTKIGCALSYYTKNAWYNAYIVCNYAYGNILKEKVYSFNTNAPFAIANAGSKCPNKKSTRYPDLCDTSFNCGIEASVA